MLYAVADAETVHEPGACTTQHTEMQIAYIGMFNTTPTPAGLGL